MDPKLPRLNEFYPSQAVLNRVKLVFSLSETKVLKPMKSTVVGITLSLVKGGHRTPTNRLCRFGINAETLTATGHRMRTCGACGPSPLVVEDVVSMSAAASWRFVLLCFFHNYIISSIEEYSIYIYLHCRRVTIAGRYSIPRVFGYGPGCFHL